MMQKLEQWTVKDWGWIFKDRDEAAIEASLPNKTSRYVLSMLTCKNHSAIQCMTEEPANRIQPVRCLETVG